MAYIGPLPAETFTSFATQEFSTSATTSYTLDHAVTNENEIALFINNVRQQPGSGKAYTASGTALTLSAATASTDTMYAVFLGRALQTVNPADASVGTSQLAATSVTAAKLNNDIISGQTALAETPADTDELLLSDGGTIKRIDYSYLKSTPGVTLLSTTDTGSGDVTNIDVTSNIDSTYRKYMVEVHRLRPESDGNYLRLQLAQGGSIVTSNNYDWVNTHHYESQSGQDDAKGQGQSHIKLSFGIGYNAAENLNNCRFFIINPSLTDLYTAVTSHTVAVTESDDFSSTETAGQLKSTTAVDGFRLSMSSGDIQANCIVKLYGLS